MTNVFVENITTEVEIEAGYDLFEVVIEDFDQAEIQRYAELAAESAAEALASEEDAADSAAAASASQIAAAGSATSASNNANSATASASTATTQAGIATTQAGIATTQAGIATTKANEASASAAAALASETDAETAATTATTQAGIATTQAGIATTQAEIATTQAGIATTQATTATTQAGIATTQAGNALTSANNAAASAVSAANSASQAAQVGTSTTLLGYTVGPNTPISASDSILTAFGEVQGQINARVSGTIATGQVAFGTAANTIGGDNGLFWNNTNKRLGVGTNAPSSELEVLSTDSDTAIRITSGLASTTTGTSTLRFQSFNSASGVIGSAEISNTAPAGGQSVLLFSTSPSANTPTERWRITAPGILQSNGAQTIQTSTGNLTLATAAGNGDINLIPNGTGKVGVNTATKYAKFHTTANTATTIPSLGTTNNSVAFAISTQTSTYGLLSGVLDTGNVWMQAQRFIGNADAFNLLLQPSGGNILIGTTTDSGFRLDVNGTARVQGQLTTTADAVVNGVNVGRGGGSLSSNTRVGDNALNANTTGSTNTALGGDALGSNTTGAQNTAVGYFALASNNGGLNTAIGRNALSSNTTGGSNTAIGGNAMSLNITGSGNTAIGNNAGRRIAAGTNLTIANNSVFLGSDTRAADDNQTNQIVIGHTAIGLGSNTTVIGNSSTTFGRWFGNLLIGTSTNVASSIFTMDSTTQGFLPPRMTSTERNAIATPATGLMVYNTTDNRPSFYNGTSWINL